MIALRVLGWITGIVLLLLLVAIVVLFNMDLGRFKPQGEQALSKLLGRELRIAGPLELSLGRDIHLHATEVTLAAPAWAKVPDLAAVKELDLVVDATTLLSDTIRIRRLKAHQLRVAIEVAQSGEDNWTFSTEVAEPAPEEDEPFTLPVTVDQLTITDSSVQYASPDRAGPLVLTAADFSGTMPDTEALQLQWQGALNELPLSLVLAASGAELATLKNADVKLSGTLQDATIGAQFTFPDLMSIAGIRGNATVSIPSVDPLLAQLHLPPFASGAVQLSAVIAPQDEGFAATVEGDLGQHTLYLKGHSASATLDADGAVEFSASGPDIAAMIALAGVEGFPAQPYQMNGKIERSGHRVTLPALQVQLADSTLTAEASAEDIRDAATLRGEAELQISELAHYNAFLQVPGTLNGPMTLQLQARARPDGPGAELQLQGQSDGIDLNGSAGLSSLQSLDGSQIEVNLVADSTLPITRALAIDTPGDHPLRVVLDAAVIGETVSIKQGELQVGKDQLAFSGDITPAEQGVGGRLSLNGQGENLAVTGTLVGVDNLPAQDFTLSTTLQLDVDTLNISDGEVRIGEDTLNIEGTVAYDPFDQPSSLEFALNVPQLKNTLSLFQLDVSSFPAHPLRARGAIHSGDGSLHFDNVVLDHGNTHLSANGSLPLPAEDGSWPDANQFQFALKARLTSLAVYNSLAKRTLPDKPVEIELNAHGAEDALLVEDLRANLAGSPITGKLTVRAGDPLKYEVQLASPKLDLLPFFAERKKTEAPPLPPQQRKTRMIPDTPLPIEALEGIDAEIALSIDQLRADRERLWLRDIEVHATLKDGALKVPDFTYLAPAGGLLSGTFNLVPQGKNMRLQTALHGENILMPLVQGTDDEQQAMPRLSVSLVADASGTTVRELAADLDGYMQVIGGPGRIKSGATASLFVNDFIGELISTLNPFDKKKPYTEVECLSVMTEFNQGMLTGNPAMVLQSERLNIFASTETDLKTEKLSVEFRTVPQKGLGISLSTLVNPYVRVGGTLTSPLLSLNPGTALVQGGAAVATGGLSILALGLKDRFLSSRTPCQDAITTGQQRVAELARRFPDLAPDN